MSGPVGDAALVLRRRAVDRVDRGRHRGAQRRLVEAKPEQAAAWDRQAAAAGALYTDLRDHGAPDTVTPRWAAHSAALERLLLPAPPPDVLRSDLLMGTMLTRGRRRRRLELGWLRTRLGARELAALVEEDPAGSPAISVREPSTSATALHHAYHLERYRASTGLAASDAGAVLEYGGGYGGFARTLRRAGGAAPPTHVIVDLPIVCLLQWTYLTTIFGPGAVDIVLRADHRPRPGAITLVPVGLAGTLRFRAALFVSLWALSESTLAAQESVRAGSWFGARRLLLGFQDGDPAFAAAENVGRLARAAGATVEPCAVHSSYAFR